MRQRAVIITFVLAASLIAAVGRAQTPADASDSAVLDRALAAAASLAGLADAIDADKAALAEGAKDAVRARASTRQTGESRPAPADLTAVSEEDVRALAAAQSDAEAAAASRAKGLSTLAALLEARVSLLRSARERCDEFDRVAEQRIWLAELKRRVDAGTIPPDRVAPGGKPADIGALIERANRILAELPAFRSQLDAELTAVVAERDALAGVEARPDPAASRNKIVIDVLARALALEGNERDEILKSPRDFAGSLPRLSEEWERDRGRMAAARGRIEALTAELAALDEGLARLEPPDPHAAPEGDGHAELRKARSAATHSADLVAWHERRVDLLSKARAAAENLVSELEKTSEIFDAVLRSSSRLRAIVARIEEVRAAGAQPAPALPPGLSTASLWESLRMLAFSEADRRGQLAVVEARRGKAAGDPEARAGLEAERANLRRLQATLADEESYGRFLQEMAALTEDDLLRLIGADGPIATSIREKEEEAARSESAVAKLDQEVRSRRDVMGAIENPYAELGIRKNAARAEEIRREVEALKDGALPEDRSARVLGTLPDDKPAVTPDGEATPDTIKQMLEAEQAFSRELRHFFADLKKKTAELKDALAALDAGVEKRAQVLSDLGNERKRAYAAARELERRQAAGKVGPEALPPGFAALLTREPIAAVVALRDDVLRRHETVRSRRLVDLGWIEDMVGLGACVEERSNAADQKAGLIVQPITHVAAAREDFGELPELERKQLEHRAGMRKSADEKLLDRLVTSLARKETRALFDEPLKTHYLELVTSERAAREYGLAAAAFNRLVDVAIAERETLTCLPASLKEAEALRILQYQNARYLAAIAGSPDKQVELESAFRTKFGRDMALPPDTRAWSRLFWADNLFAAEMRLWGHRRWLRESERFLSKLGSEAEIARYRRQIAKIGADQGVVESRRAKLVADLDELQASYIGTARLDALLGLGATLLIVGVAWGLVRVIKRVRRRILGRPMSGLDPEETERRRRLETVTRVASAAVTGVIWVLAAIYVLERLGVDVTPILASAGVAGLAVAFGAQTLIRDYLSGFFILIENQFTIGDVVDVGGVAGVVEGITLRVTVLRDAEGVVHYVPNGTLARVSNKTQGWSCAIVDVGVGYREDLDHVTSVLRQALARLQADLPWKFLILEEPNVMGVQQLADSSISIRVAVKCRPGKQWDLSREINKRIKQAFDDAGIEIPFPQRVVHHVHEDKSREDPTPAPSEGRLADR